MATLAHPLAIESDGHRLAAERWQADGPVIGEVVLAHGGGQTRHSWQRTAAALAAQGWRAIAYDARGHGDSEWRRDSRYEIDGHVHDLQAVVRHCEGPPVLVGASLGGMVSLLAQGEGEDIARAIVLVDVAPRVERSGVGRILGFMRAHRDGFGSLDEVAQALRDYNPHRSTQASVEGLKKNVRRHADGRWYWHWDPAILDTAQDISRVHPDDRLAAAAQQIRIPTLLIRGGQSDVVSDASVDQLRALIPHARHINVAHTGHMVAGDDNDVFTNEVLLFLAQLVETQV